MLEETVIYIKQASREAQQKLPPAVLSHVLRSHEADDGSFTTVLNGQTIFTAGAEIDFLRQLVEAGDAQVSLDLAHYMPHDAVCSSFEIPKACLELATELRATFKISIYIITE